jgi:hypothetical protein
MGHKKFKQLWESFFKNMEIEAYKIIDNGTPVVNKSLIKCAHGDHSDFEKIEEKLKSREGKEDYQEGFAGNG